MVSTYSTRLRTNYQAPGDNLNTWGTTLNAGVFQLLEDAIARRVAFTLSGTKTLTSVNGATDEARCAYLEITSGTGGTITAPSVEKWYIVRNGSNGDVILTTGAGLTATVKAGDVCIVVCDATNFRRVQPTDFAGSKLTNVADPTSAQDAATKAYADALAFTANAGILPGQVGSNGYFLNTNGTTASWFNLFGTANTWTAAQGFSVTSAAIALPVVLKNPGAGLQVGISMDPTAGGSRFGQVVAKDDGSGNVVFDFYLSKAGAPAKIATLDYNGALSLGAGLLPTGPVVTPITALAALDVDCSKGEFFTKTIATGSTFTFSNPTSGAKAQGFFLELTISSAAIPTWPATVKWTGGSAPSLGNGVHLLSFVWNGSASAWRGNLVSFNFS